MFPRWLLHNRTERQKVTINSFEHKPPHGWRRRGRSRRTMGVVGVNPDEVKAAERNGELISLVILLMCVLPPGGIPHLINR